MDETNATPEDDSTPHETRSTADESESTPQDAEAESAAEPSDSEPEGAGAEGDGVIAFDLTGSGGLSEAEADALRTLHQQSAKELGQAIGSAVEAEVAVELKSVTEEPYREFHEALSAGSCLATVALRPLGEDVGISMDSGLAFPLIDLLLGGTGDAEDAREITAIEAGVLENVVRVTARALQTTWRPVLDQAFVFGRYLVGEETGSLMAPGEPALLLRFEVKLPASGGELTIVLNPATSSALLRKLSARSGDASRPDRSGVNERLGHHILNTPFRVEAVLRSAPVPARELIGLKAGDVLTLPHALDEPAVIVVEGQPMLQGIPVQHEHSRAVEVLSRLDSTGQVETKETA